MAQKPLTLEFETAKFERWTTTFLQGVEPEVATKGLKKLAFDFLAKVIKRTPVDTGRARAGWTAFLDKEGQIRDIRQFSPPPGGSNNTIEQDAVDEGKRDSDFRARLRGSRQYVTIINGVHYIVGLEFGGSDQAPAGMLRLTMREMQVGDKATVPYMERLEKLIIKADAIAGW